MMPFPFSEKELNKIRSRLSDAAQKFAKVIASENAIKPDFGGIMVFHVFRTLCKITPQILKADYKYYSEKNAYNAETKWYVPAKVSFFKHKFVSFMEKRIEKSIEKMIDFEALKSYKNGFKNKL